MKIKKILFIIFVIIATLIIFNVKSDATLELNELDFDAQINSDGSMDVTETWDINISKTNTLFKTFKVDNSKYSSIAEVQVTDISSNINFSQINEEMYHVTKNCYYALRNSDGAFEIAWGVGLDNSSARKTYQISYKVNDAIAKYNAMHFAFALQCVWCLQRNAICSVFAIQLCNAMRLLFAMQHVWYTQSSAMCCISVMQCNLFYICNAICSVCAMHCKAVRVCIAMGLVFAMQCKVFCT